MHLAARLGISRTPLREALRRLIAEGLVTGDFNRRMRVSELDLEDFDQIYAMRFALEPVGIQVTIPMLTDRERSELTCEAERMEAAEEAADRESFRRAHRVPSRADVPVGRENTRHAGRAVGPLGTLSTPLPAPGRAGRRWDHSRVPPLAAGGAPGHSRCGAGWRCANCTAHQLAQMQHTLAAVFQEAAPPPVPRMSRLAAGEGVRA